VIYDQNDPFADTYAITNRDVQRSFSAFIIYDGVRTLEVHGSLTEGTAYNVESTAGFTNTNIYGGNGNDFFNISPTNHNLGDIQGRLFIDGGGGFNFINMWDDAVRSYTVANTFTVAGDLPLQLTYDHIVALVLSTKLGSTVTDETGYWAWDPTTWRLYWASHLTVYYTP
jgi:hypothetical protein